MNVPLYQCVLRKQKTVRLKQVRAQCFEQARDVFQQLTQDSPQELLMVVGLNSSMEVIGVQIVAQGGLAGCGVLPREIFRPAILMNAAAIIIGHNHPSGNPEPSEDDRSMTAALVNVGDLLGISVVDHIVVSRKGSRSILQSQD